MIRRPPRSTLDRSSAASDVYKRQRQRRAVALLARGRRRDSPIHPAALRFLRPGHLAAVSYTHLRAHETVLDLVCRLLLEKTKTESQQYVSSRTDIYAATVHRYKEATLCAPLLTS